MTGALGEIPTEASVEALLDYVADVGLDDWSAEILTDLGHPRVIPVLQEAYRPGDQLLAQFLCVLGVLNGSTDPAMDRWRAEALTAHERFERALGGELPPLPPVPSLRTEAEPALLQLPGRRPRPTSSARNAAARRKPPAKPNASRRKRSAADAHLGDALPGCLSRGIACAWRRPIGPSPHRLGRPRPAQDGGRRNPPAPACVIWCGG